MTGEHGQLRLNLGCGNDVLPGYVNVDVSRHRPDIDVVHDLRLLPWPWADDAAAAIRLVDVLEHLPEVVPYLDECWRLLRPGGVLHLSVPHYLHENSWLDPTHRRPFHPETFDYFDPETKWGSTYGFYTTRYWKVEHREVCDGSVVVLLRPRKGPAALLETWPDRERYLTWEMRVALALEEIVSRVPPGQPFILVDEEQWGSAARVGGRLRVPFVERSGHYHGPPEDDAAAIRELDRLQRRGAGFVAVGWPAFWWLEHYPDWHAELRRRGRAVIENDRVIVFDLRGSAPAAIAVVSVGEPEAAAPPPPPAWTEADRERWRRTGDLRAFERRVSSQNGEDGILEEILRRVGVETAFFVEIGSSDGRECNGARLVTEEHWGGVFVEGDAGRAAALRARYRGTPGVRCVEAWVNSDSIEALLATHEVPRLFDVLSIDIDGNDYWVWKAVQRFEPRIVVIEYNPARPPGQLWVMQENRGHGWDGTDYYGASLSSLAALGRDKGYVLVGTDTAGVNAFFVRRELAPPGRFPAPDVRALYSPARSPHPAGEGAFVAV